ncbi:hypothetical protein HNQ34_000006 [Anoxybacillus tepidamans]|uniref:GmrSD restriction endonucleases N-terminal domain-containing protein n=1 Tax=Anoxybacteroides tepidamans TaxID=265948 RepID=A0A7W8INR8_9BACL|nr:DUF262 domain-containing protein [Anoxybacillus tepidamans]MBB5322929.1 hypothetical protein [Anoxybacillus tepidamans]
MIAPQQTESIKNLVENIHKENILLPEFQRDFVWELGKTCELFDSLVRDIFIGSIIYGKPSFEITVREIDKRPRKGEGSRKKLVTKFFDKEDIQRMTQINNFRLILDGQQRATSIYRALTGVDEVWFIAKNEEELETSIREKEFRERTLEEMLFEFSLQEDEDRLSIKLSDAFLISKGDILDDDIKENYFGKLSFIAGMDEEELKLAFRKYRMICVKLGELFNSEKLLSYYLLNMNTEKFALFFERSNSKGIQLNFIDILAAKLYKGFNLRQKIEELESSFPNYHFNREIIVRTISYIVSNGKEVDRNYILSNLNYEHFNMYWDEVCNCYRKVLDFLFKERFIISQKWMPYENMLIPLIIFLRSIHKTDFSQMNENQHEFIKYWYWSSIFAQRYSSGSNEAIIQDASILSNIAQNKKISDKAFFSRLKIQITSLEDILSFSKKGNVIYKGILNLINFASKGLIDWSNSSQLHLNSKLEDHHIFPKEYIKNKFKDNEQILSLIDCVANRTLIPKITNIKIGKKSPSQYLKELMKINPNIVESLKNHLIPIEIIDGVYDDFYIVFLEKRAESIFKLIEKYIIAKEQKIVDLFYQPPKTKGNIKIFASYYNKKVEAIFDIETQQVHYNGEVLSVSAAADKAKYNLSGKDNTSTNGWKFWKYINDQNQERYIDDFRKYK